MSFPLTPAGVAALCEPQARQVVIDIVDETGSTNADLVARLDRLAGPTLLLAHAQTAGRGRAGRAWHAAPGKSLTFSLAWRFDAPVQALVGLPLAVGVALAEALAMFELKVGLKWPNDVLHEGRKLAGILIETAAVGPASWAVTGIGLNLALDDKDAARIGRPVASVPWLAALDPNLLLATLLNRLAETMLQFGRNGFAGFAARWNALHVYAGREVKILDNGRVLQEGAALGVDASGRFLLRTAAGTVAVLAGDVSLRTKEE